MFVQVASVNDKMEDLLGEIAEEKERADNVTSELESCRSLLKQTVEDFEHTKVCACNRCGSVSILNV